MLDLICFVAAILIALFLSKLMISIASKHNLYDYPGGRKQHIKPTPYLGGVAIFGAFWIVFLAVIFFGEVRLNVNPNFLPAFFLSSVVIFLTGLIDDYLELKYYMKILAPVVAALILIAFDFKIEMLYIPFYRSFELGSWSYLITIMWVVLISNSINFIDGMDGLAAMVSVSICLGLMIVALFLEITVVSLIAIILAGSLMGFFMLNKPPARIFMGDNGSLFIGHVFAVVAVICPIKSYTAVSMFVPLVAVSLPLLEITVTVIRRIWNKQNLSEADNHHIHHYLQRFNFTPKAVLIILTTVSLLFNAFIPALFWFDRKQVFSIFVVFLMLLVAIFFIFKLSRGAKKL